MEWVDGEWELGDIGRRRGRDCHTSDYGKYVHFDGCDGGGARLDYDAGIEQRFHDSGQWEYERSVR
jgi:hypothetical protein